MLAETVQLVARRGRRAARPVLRHRADAGGRLGAGPADRARARSRMLPLYLDSPMASKASRHLPAPPRVLRRGDAQAARARATRPLDYPDQTITQRRQAVEGDRRAPRPYMIVASNGMLTGGRVVGHLRNLIDDPAATILFVGYQGVGTLGAHLQAGAKTVKLDGQVRAGPLPGPLDQRLLGPRGRVGAARLARQLRHGRANRATPGFPRKVFLVHGDPRRSSRSRRRSRPSGFEVHIPHWRERSRSR